MFTELCLVFVILFWKGFCDQTVMLDPLMNPQVDGLSVHTVKATRPLELVNIIEIT